MIGELIAIERKEGVTIYGRIVDKGGKLGRYEVHSEILGYDENVYSNYSEAETKMAALIGFQNTVSKKQSQKVL